MEAKMECLLFNPHPDLCHTEPPSSLAHSHLEPPQIAVRNNRFPAGFRCRPAPPQLESRGSVPPFPSPSSTWSSQSLVCAGVRTQ